MEEIIQRELESYDGLFEWFILILTFIEAMIYQFFTWLSNNTKEIDIYRVMSVTAYLILPLLFVLLPLVLGIILSKYDMKKGLYCRVFSLGALLLTFVYSMNQIKTVIFSISYFYEIPIILLYVIGSFLLATPIVFSGMFYYTFYKKFIKKFGFEKTIIFFGKEHNAYSWIFQLGIFLPLIIMIFIQYGFGIYSI